MCGIGQTALPDPFLPLSTSLLPLRSFYLAPSTLLLLPCSFCLAPSTSGAVL